MTSAAGNANAPEVDVVVCATGYAAADYLGQLDVSGEQGTTLRETWSEGAHAYFGMVVPGFPNFFMLYGPNTNVGSNSVTSCWKPRLATSSER